MLDFETIKVLYLQSEIDPENLKKYPEIRFESDIDEDKEFVFFSKKPEKSP